MDLHGHRSRARDGGGTQKIVQPQKGTYGTK
jgi:hypothetical protein